MKSKAKVTLGYALNKFVEVSSVAQETNYTMPEADMSAHEDVMAVNKNKELCRNSTPLS